MRTQGSWPFRPSMRPPRPAPSWVLIKARPQIKARPKIRTWPPLPRIPHPNAARVFPKPSTQGYTYISGPTPAPEPGLHGPAADQVTQQPAAPAPCRPSTPQQLRLLHLLPAILNLFRSQARRGARTPRGGADTSPV